MPVSILKPHQRHKPPPNPPPLDSQQPQDTKSAAAAAAVSFAPTATVIDAPNAEAVAGSPACATTTKEAAAAAVATAKALAAQSVTDVHRLDAKQHTLGVALPCERKPRDFQVWDMTATFRRKVKGSQTEILKQQVVSDAFSIQLPPEGGGAAVASAPCPLQWNAPGIEIGFYVEGMATCPFVLALGNALGHCMPCKDFFSSTTLTGGVYISVKEAALVSRHSDRMRIKLAAFCLDTPPVTQFRDVSRVSSAVTTGELAVFVDLDAFASGDSDVELAAIISAVAHTWRHVCLLTTSPPDHVATRSRIQKCMLRLHRTDSRTRHACVHRMKPVAYASGERKCLSQLLPWPIVTPWHARICLVLGDADQWHKDDRPPVFLQAGSSNKSPRATGGALLIFHAKFRVRMLSHLRHAFPSDFGAFVTAHNAPGAIPSAETARLYDTFKQNALEHAHDLQHLLDDARREANLYTHGIDERAVKRFLDTQVARAWSMSTTTNATWCVTRDDLKSDLVFAVAIGVMLAAVTAADAAGHASAIAATGVPPPELPPAKRQRLT